jgi:DHA1 family multidrug resistance protein-like MFS transporter
LLVYNSTNQIAGRIFSYNLSFRDIGNVTGPLMGASVSASYGFRTVFLVTACVVMFNAIYTGLSMRRRRQVALASAQNESEDRSMTH